MEPKHQFDIRDWLLDNIGWVVGWLAVAILVGVFVFRDQIGDQEDRIAGQEDRIAGQEDQIAQLRGQIARLEAKLPSSTSSTMSGCISAVMSEIESKIGSGQTDWAGAGDTGDADYGWGGSTGIADFWRNDDHRHSHSLDSGWAGDAGHTHSGPQHKHSTSGRYVSLSVPRSCR